MQIRVSGSENVKQIFQSRLFIIYHGAACSERPTTKLNLTRCVASQGLGRWAVFLITCNFCCTIWHFKYKWCWLFIFVFIFYIFECSSVKQGCPGQIQWVQWSNCTPSMLYPWRLTSLDFSPPKSRDATRQLS